MSSHSRARAYTHIHTRLRVFRESGRVLLMARIVLLCLRDERITVRCPLSEQPWDNVAPRAVVNQASFLNNHIVIRGVYGSPGARLCSRLSPPSENTDVFRPISVIFTFARTKTLRPANFAKQLCGAR